MYSPLVLIVHQQTRVPTVQCLLSSSRLHVAFTYQWFKETRKWPVSPNSWSRLKITMRKLAKKGTEMNPGRAQWRIFPEYEKYYSILNKYFQSLSARASPALLKGCKSPGSATWSTHRKRLFFQTSNTALSKNKLTSENTQWAHKNHCLRRNPPLEQEASWGTECLNALRLGAQPSCSHTACPALQTEPGNAFSALFHLNITSCLGGSSDAVLSYMSSGTWQEWAKV